MLDARRQNKLVNAFSIAPNSSTTGPKKNKIKIYIKINKKGDDYNCLNIQIFKDVTTEFVNIDCFLFIHMKWLLRKVRGIKRYSFLFMLSKA